jgi:ATP-binding cassette subfamily C protein
MATRSGREELREAMRRCKGGVAYAGCLGLFINVLHLVVPFYMVQVYDRVVPGRSMDTLIMLTLLALAGLLFLAMLEYVRARVFVIVGERFAGRIGQPVLMAAVRDSLRSNGEAGREAMRDVQELRQFLTGGPISLPFDAVFAPLFLTVLFLVHPAFGVLGIVGALLLALMSFALEVVSRPQADANRSAMRSHIEVGTAIRNAEVIEAMGMLDAIGLRWRQGQQQALRMVGSGTTAAKAIATAARTLRTAIQIAVLATGAVLIINNAASPGSMFAAMIMTGRLLNPFEQMIQGWRQWRGAFGAWDRLKQLLGGFVQDRSEMRIDRPEGALVVDRVNFVPGGSDRLLLKGIHFHLEPRSVLGILGTSGAGKSTLARLLVGVWRPTSGGVYLDGHDAYAAERTSFGRYVGYLPQSPVLLDGTVRENIARFSDTDPGAVFAAARAAGIHEMIGRLPRGYETVVGDGGFLLSGGQRQRIALARALFGEPRLLVLDEPNASLDGEGEQALVKAIERARAGGAIVIVVAQRLSVMVVADHLMVLRDGAMEHFGERAHVMRLLSAQGSMRKADTGKVAHLPVAQAAAR